MLAGLPRNRTAAGMSPDGGFTMVELLVAIGVMGVIMTALTSFFVTTVGVTGQQGSKQAAIRVAADGIERVRALPGSAVLGGRDKVSTDSQWASPASGVASYLTDMVPAWDSTAAFPAGATAPLPTSPRTVEVDRVRYAQHWYVGTCWQPTTGGDCRASTIDGYVELLRVVVAVTWPERHCPSGTCSYAASTLVSGASGEPVFDGRTTLPPPAIINPGGQTSALSVTVSVQFACTGGVPAVTWSASGLPPGLTMTSSGQVTGAATAAGGYAVTLRVTDALRHVGTASLVWTVTSGLTVADPGTQVTGLGAAVRLAMQVTGGTNPMTWSVTRPGAWGTTGLPPGLRLTTTTGLISGTPTRAGTGSVTISIRDRNGKTASVTFTWTITALAVTTPAAQTGRLSVAVTPVQVVASGGTAPYTWRASGLPTGLSISSTGLISGTPTRAGAFGVTVTVTDAARRTATTSRFTWTITAPLVISTPTTAARTTNVGSTVNLQARATGGSAPYTWSAVNLPPGLTIDAAGLIRGQATTCTRFVVTVRVTDAAGLSAETTFVWSIRARSGYLSVTAPTGDRTGDRAGQSVTIAAQASGSGAKTFTWRASGLPPGMAISSAGVVSGTLSAAGTYLVTLTAESNNNKTAIFMFTWTVT